MGANQQYTRIDTLELKALMYQKLGQQRADKYFNLLNKLFSLQLSKNNFDKFCIRTIGRENLPLHNLLISSLVKNAALAKSPPPTVKKIASSLNGFSFPLSPRKNRSPRSPRDRKFKDRPSPLGPNGKSQPEFHQSPTELHSLGKSQPPVEVLSVEDGEEVVSGSPGIQSRSPVTAPLGISLKTNTSRKTSYRASGYCLKPQTCYNTCELPDSKYLRNRIKQKLECEGVSVSEDCANLVNVGLDAYLKRLIEPCIGLARSKISQTQPRFNRSLPGSYQQRPRISTVSSLEFNVAMENDPRKLGGDWMTQYEKLRFSALA